MVLTEVIKNSFSEYRASFKDVSKSVILFYVLPFLVVSILGYVLGGYAFYSYSSDALSGFSYWAWEIIYFISLLLTLFVYIGLIGATASGVGVSVEEVINEGKKNYLKSLGIALWSFGVLAIPVLITSLIMLFTQSSWVLLILILLIPAFVVSVYWSVALFVLAERGEGVISALQGSAQMIRGNWWKTVAYLLVFFVISWLILLVVNFVFYLLVLGGSMLFANSVNVFLIVGIVLNLLSQIIVNLILLPFSVFFFKNYYQSLK